MSVDEFDERDEWAQSWTKLKTRGADTSELSTVLVLGAFRGENRFRQQVLLEAANDDEQLGSIIFGAFRLCCELSRRSRTAAGLMGIGVALQDIEETAPADTTRAAARLLLSFGITDDVAHFDDIDGLDPGMFWALGAADYNTTLTEAGASAHSVVIAALDLWRQLLPEVSTLTIETVAAQLWSD